MKTVTTLSALTLGLAIAGYAIAMPFGGCDSEFRKQVLLAKYDTVEPLGTITLDEVQAVRLARFQAMDADGNGSVTAEERNAYRKAQKQARFTAIDTNADGQLSLEEFQQARSPHIPEGVALPENHADRAAMKFSRIDSDANGFVTLAELEAMRRGGKRGCNGRIDNDGNGEMSQDEFLANVRLFDRLDTNEDGAITEAEMDAAPCGHRRQGGGQFQR